VDIVKLTVNWVAAKIKAVFEGKTNDWKQHAWLKIIVYFCFHTFIEADGIAYEIEELLLLVLMLLTVLLAWLLLLYDAKNNTKIEK